jgi:hypothetical protein
MKKYYQIFEMRDVEVCTPSTDYYARAGDWYKENIILLQGIYDDNVNYFNSEDEAEEKIKCLIDKYPKTSYYILPFYMKS